jgi:hypothetical protein
MKTMADILRERGKLGPYTTRESTVEEPVDSPVVSEEPPRKRPRRTLPPVDF